jgi:peptidoglycan/LPS O-acetylase OafA/YrhL
MTMAHSNVPALTGPATATIAKTGIRHRLEALTTIRLFAALHVVFFHFSGSVFHFSPLLTKTVNVGYYAVSMFYVLSGFVLVFAYSDAAGSLRGTRGEFWLARMTRIYPAYLLAFILCIPSVAIFAIHSYPGYTGLVKAAISGASYLLMVQAWLPRLASWWNFPGWSVSVEAFFYLCFPFLQPRILRLGIRQCYALIGACWVASLLVYVVSHRIPDLETNPWWASALGYNPLVRLPTFLTGMAVGRIFLLRQTAERSPVRLIGAAILCLLAIGWSLLLTQGTLRDTILAPAFALLVYSCAADRSWIVATLSFGPLVLLGEASYSTYILQWPVFSLSGLSVPTITAWKLLGFVLLLLLLSVLSFRYLESPLRRAIRRRAA